MAEGNIQTVASIVVVVVVVMMGKKFFKASSGDDALLYDSALSIGPQIPACFEMRIMRSSRVTLGEDEIRCEGRKGIRHHLPWLPSWCCSKQNHHGENRKERKTVSILNVYM